MTRFIHAHVSHRVWGCVVLFVGVPLRAWKLDGHFGTSDDLHSNPTSNTNRLGKLTLKTIGQNSVNHRVEPRTPQTAASAVARAAGTNAAAADTTAAPVLLVGKDSIVPSALLHSAIVANDVSQAADWRGQADSLDVSDYSAGSGMVAADLATSTVRGAAATALAAATAMAAEVTAVSSAGAARSSAVGACVSRALQEATWPQVILGGIVVYCLVACLCSICGLTPHSLDQVSNDRGPALGSMVTVATGVPEAMRRMGSQLEPNPLTDLIRSYRRRSHQRWANS